MVNGRVSNDGNTFFLGFAGFVSALNQLNTDIANIKANLSSVKPSLTSIDTNDCVNSKSSIELLPDGTTANASLTLSYTDPTPASPVGTTLASSFASVLGNAPTTGTIAYGLYSMTTGVCQSIPGLVTTITNIENQMTTFTTSLSSVTVNVETISNQTIANDQSLTTTFLSLGSIVNSLKSVLLAFFSVMFVSVIITGIGMVLAWVLKKTNMKWVLTMGCVLLGFATFLGFIVGTLMSATLVGSYLTCGTLQQVVSTPSILNRN